MSRQQQSTIRGWRPAVFAAAGLLVLAVGAVSCKVHGSHTCVKEWPDLGSIAKKSLCNTFGGCGARNSFKLSHQQRRALLCSDYCGCPICANNWPRSNGNLAVCGAFSSCRADVNLAAFRSALSVICVTADAGCGKILKQLDERTREKNCRQFCGCHPCEVGSHPPRFQLLGYKRPPAEPPFSGRYDDD